MWTCLLLCNKIIRLREQLSLGSSSAGAASAGAASSSAGAEGSGDTIRPSPHEDFYFFFFTSPVTTVPEHRASISFLKTVYSSVALTFSTTFSFSEQMLN